MWAFLIKRPGLIIAAVAALAVVALGLSWNARGEKIEELNQQIIGWNTAVTTLKSAVEKNDAAIADCRAINAENTAEVRRIEGALEAAEARVAEGDRRAESGVEEAYREERELREGDDATCRTLGDPLPESFVAGLRRQ